jgi:hypothetical protein
VREQGECVMGKVERKHVHNDVQVSEEWISPPGCFFVISAKKNP